MRAATALLRDRDAVALFEAIVRGLDHVRSAACGVVFVVAMRRCCGDATGRFRSLLRPCVARCTGYADVPTGCPRSSIAGKLRRSCAGRGGGNQRCAPFRRIGLRCAPTRRLG